MKKIIAATMISCALLVAGCDNTVAEEQSPAPVLTGEQGAASPVITDTPAASGSMEPTATGGLGSEDKISQKLDGLTADRYEGLEMTAEILERKAIIPGGVVPVTVLVKNTGDKTITYTHGSGSVETPDALMVSIEGLQAIMPEDRLGPMTMDLQTKELKPGEELKFVANVMVIEPNSKFDEYTYEIHGKDKTYIGSLEFPDLQKLYADLKAAASGTYDGTVYFMYTMPEEGKETINLGEGEQSYTEARFKITVNE